MKPAPCIRSSRATRYGTKTTDGRRSIRLRHRTAGRRAIAWRRHGCSRSVGMTKRIVLLPGDGVGPEVVDAAVRVLDAATDEPVEYQTLLAGGAAIDAHGTPLRPEDLETCRQADAVLLGAVGGPKWDELPVESRPERALLALRSELNLGINLRPVTWTEAGGVQSPLKPETAASADIAFVRELTGGVYFGRPSYVQGEAPNREAVDTGR